MNRVIAYIDGFNLYFGLKSKNWKRYYWLNLQLLVENLLKSDQTLIAVKYFTARISASNQNPAKQKRQANYLDAVEALDKTKIIFGHYLPKLRQCNKCGAKWTTHEEKMTDVNIAVELIQDALDNDFDVALLMSADSDLSAPISFVRHRFPEKRIIMACPPDRQSKKLESLVNATFRIGRKKFQDSQFPDTVRLPNGYVIHKPAEWV